VAAAARTAEKMAIQAKKRAIAIGAGTAVGVHHEHNGEKATKRGGQECRDASKTKTHPNL
jgi:hypothetical protein